MNDYEQLKSLIDNLKEKYQGGLFHPEKKSILSNPNIKKRGVPIVPEDLLNDITEFYYELNDFFLYTDSVRLTDNYGNEVLNLLNTVYKVLSKKLGKSTVPSMEELIKDLSEIILDDKDNEYDRKQIIFQIKEEIWEELKDKSLNNYDQDITLNIFKTVSNNLCDCLPLMNLDFFDLEILEKLLNFLMYKCIPFFAYASFLNFPLYPIEQEFNEDTPGGDSPFEKGIHDSGEAQVQSVGTIGFLGKGFPKMATYKLSIVPPLSLKLPFNELEYQHETMLAVLKGGKNLQRFLNGKVNSMPNNLKQMIMTNIARYQRYTKPNLRKALKDNQAQMDFFLRKEAIYRKNSLNKGDFPRFKDKSHPNVTEISISDFKYLSALGVKQLAGFVEAYTQNAVKKLPLNFDEIIEQGLINANTRKKTNYTQKTLERRSDKAIAEALNDKGNYAGSAQKLIGRAYKAKRELEDKLEDLRALFFPETGTTGFEPVSQIIGFNYSVPRHLMNYLRAKWKITDANWVRNTIVGWRRRIDGHLPDYMQIESQNQWTENLRNKILNIGNITEKELIVISKLQKERVLHIFADKSGPDLSFFLNPDEEKVSIRLRNRLPAHLLAPYSKYISNLSGYFEAALTSLRNEISQRLTQMNKDSTSYKNTEVFGNKLSYLDIPEILILIMKYLPYSLPGPRFTKALTKIIQSTNVYKRFYSVMRSVMASAFALKYPGAIDQLNRALISEYALTPPFRSEKRKKRYLPIELVYPKYVILRKEDPNKDGFLSYNSDELTKVTVSSLFKDGKPIWLGIPIFNSDVLEKGKQTGKLRTLGFLWNPVFPSKKIIYALNHEAIVRNMRVLPPDGPSRKVIIDVTLSSPAAAAFKHGTAFLKDFDQKCNILIPKGAYFGTDLNRICRHLIGAAVNGHEIPLWKCTLTDGLEKIQNLIAQLTHKELPSLQRKKHKLEKKSESSNYLATQITLLHKRIEHLRDQAHLDGIMNLVYLIKKSGAKYVQWDGVEGITHRGTSGGLAKAITGMPKSGGFYETFVEWLNDAYPLGGFPLVVVLEPPRSMVCPDAYRRTGIQSMTAQPSPLGYDFIICNGQPWSRHGASAAIGSIMLENYILKHSAG